MRRSKTFPDLTGAFELYGTFLRPYWNFWDVQNLSTKLFEWLIRDFETYIICLKNQLKLLKFIEFSEEPIGAFKKTYKRFRRANLRV